MTVKTTKPAINLRDALAKLAGLKPAPRRHTFFFDGDGVKVDFALPSGWRVRDVFVDGGLYRPGVSEGYTIKRGVYSDTVTMAVAPGAVSIGIQAEAHP